MSGENEPARYVKPKAAEAHFGVDRRTLKKWADSGHIRCFQPGGSGQRLYDISATSGPRHPISAVVSTQPTLGPNPQEPPTYPVCYATGLCLCVTATVFGKWFTSAPGGRWSYRAPVVKLMLHRSDVSAGSLVRIHPPRAVNIRERSDASGFAPSCCCALCNANRRGGGVSTLRFVESTDDESTFAAGRA